LVQAFLKKWWVESDFKAPNLPLSGPCFGLEQNCGEFQAVHRIQMSLLITRYPTEIHLWTNDKKRTDWPPLKKTTSYHKNE
jgi:hypothetical protein